MVHALDIWIRSVYLDRCKNPTFSGSVACQTPMTTYQNDILKLRMQMDELHKGLYLGWNTEPTRSQDQLNWVRESAQVKGHCATDGFIARI